ncbi:SufD family Fe-S cluster assembly protein [bacterium]|nr:SufD family Fe-S cluster assembly protein [bacterium]
MPKINDLPAKTWSWTQTGGHGVARLATREHQVAAGQKQQVVQTASDFSLPTKQIWTVAAGAHLQLLQLFVRPGERLVETVIELVGAGASVDIESAYALGSKDFLSLNYVVRVRAPGARAVVNTTGHMYPGARKIWRSTLEFEPGSPGAAGNEHEQVLLLGKPAQNVSAPLVLTHERRVDATHGVQVLTPETGETAFYARARGWTSERLAREVARAQLERVARMIADEGRRARQWDDIQGENI